MSCGIGRRHSLNLALLCLWYRLAAVAQIAPLAWELSYAVGADRGGKKKKEVGGFKESREKLDDQVSLGQVLGRPLNVSLRNLDFIL